MGNAITSIICSIIAITTWKNNAYMAITDIFVCDTGTFIPSKSIQIPFNQLKYILSKIENIKHYLLFIKKRFIINKGD